MIAFNFKGFFKSSWNIFDLTIICINVIGMTFNEFKVMKILVIGPQVLYLAKVLRVARLFKIMKKLKGL